MKRSIVVALSVIFCIMLVACSGNSSEMIKMSASASDYQGKDYRDIMHELSGRGFTNIQTEKLEDLIKGWLTKDGEVESISIDGNSEFTKGDKFDKNVKIVITYHTFPSKDDDLNSSTDITKDKSYRTETEKWIESNDFAQCLEDGKFPSVPGNNPYGSGVNESTRNQNIYYLNYSMKGPWGEESKSGEYFYYIPSGKYLVMNVSNPKQYDHIPTACNVYVCNPKNDEEMDKYYFAKYGETKEIVIPDGYYISLTISAIVTLEPLLE